MTTPTAARRPFPVSAVPPYCTIVTGPDAVENARWIGSAVHTLRSERPAMRSAVLASPETATALKRFADLLPGDRVRHLWLACLCCPGAADLPGQIRALAGDAGADRIFVDLPVSGAIGLIAEFDVQKPWRREIVVCLSAAWSASRRQGRLSPYQCRLIRVADSVVHVSPNLSKPGSEVLN